MVKVVPIREQEKQEGCGGGGEEWPCRSGEDVDGGVWEFGSLGV